MNDTSPVVVHEDGLRRWPRRKSAAALVTVNFDAEALLLAADPGMARRAKTMSVLRYGVTRGVDRLLATFAEAGLATTWFVPATAAAAHPEAVRKIAAAGHEVALRGHDVAPLDGLSTQARAELLAESVATLSALIERPVQGFRLPVGEWPLTLARQLADVGIAWSSSWLGDDTPFVLPAGEGRRLVEIPLSYATDDRTAFFWNLNPPFPAGQARISSYAEVLDNWLLELEGCRREGLLFVLQLHPEISGTPGRITLVERVLDELRRDDRIWCPTAGELASWWSANHPGNPDGHPADIFHLRTTMEER